MQIAVQVGTKENASKLAESERAQLLLQAQLMQVHNFAHATENELKLQISRVAAAESRNKEMYGNYESLQVYCLPTLKTVLTKDTLICAHCGFLWGRKGVIGLNVCSHWSAREPDWCRHS